MLKFSRLMRRLSDLYRSRIHARWISLNYSYATSSDNDKGSGREVRKYNYGVAYHRPGDQAVITRTAELNTCGVVNSPFSRAAIDRSINLRAPVAIRRPLYTIASDMWSGSGVADGSGLRAIHTTCIDYKSPPVKCFDRHGSAPSVEVLLKLK